MQAYARGESMYRFHVWPFFTHVCTCASSQRKFEVSHSSVLNKHTKTHNLAQRSLGVRALFSSGITWSQPGFEKDLDLLLFAPMFALREFVCVWDQRMLFGRNDASGLKIIDSLNVLSTRPVIIAEHLSRARSGQVRIGRENRPRTTYNVDVDDDRRGNSRNYTEKDHRHTRSKAITLFPGGTPGTILLGGILREITNLR